MKRDALGKRTNVTGQMRLSFVVLVIFQGNVLEERG